MPAILNHFRCSKSITILAIISFLFIAYSCDQPKHKNKNGNNGVAEVAAKAETVEVDHDDDAADDPAIWYNQKDPAKSIVFGSDKKGGGIYAYNLNGDILFYEKIGRINNIDVRYNFPLTEGKIDIIGGTNRTDNSLALFKIDPDSGYLENILAQPVISRVEEVYGFALHHNPKKNLFYAFINDKDGHVEQWKLIPTDTNTVDVEKVRTFSVGGQTEGMVIDDHLGYLYIGQENKGIWKYHAAPDKYHDRVLVADTSKKYIKHDVEGLTIYHSDSINGYLIASIQGLNTYAVFERSGVNKYIGSFKIVDGRFDGVSETDGIDVLNTSLGAAFPKGVFVVQDGYNHQGGKLINQNFKLVAWEDIADVFEPELIINQEYFPFE